LSYHIFGVGSFFLAAPCRAVGLTSDWKTVAETRWRMLRRWRSFWLSVSYSIGATTDWAG